MDEVRSIAEIRRSVGGESDGAGGDEDEDEDGDDDGCCDCCGERGEGKEGILEGGEEVARCCMTVVKCV